MGSEPLKTRLSKWLDTALSDDVPSDIVAFNFNLYEEPFRVDLVGATYYSAKDSDWACEEAFVPEPRFFDFPARGMPKLWQEKLTFARVLLEECVGNSSTSGERLRAAQAVTVGFVDGDLIRIWPAPKLRPRTRR
jgi:hypothetical protein